MDKFGFFNLLNSVLGQNGKNQSLSNGENPNLKGGGGGGENTFMNGILSLLNGLSNSGVKLAPQDKKDASSPVPERAYLPPLQSSMISVMQNHDLIEKRVKENAQKKSNH